MSDIWQTGRSPAECQEERSRWPRYDAAAADSLIVMGVEFIPPEDREPGSGKPAEKQRGPVRLRRDQGQTTTTDQRFLDTRGPSDWGHADPWRVLRHQAEFVEGFGRLAQVGTAISGVG